MIELHTTPTANGYKVSIMLEETGLPYRAVAYDLTRGDHMKPEYLARNPVGRVPLIIDDDTASGKPLTVYGSAACLLYLAEKSRRFMPAGAEGRARVYQWLGTISSDVGPAYSGQFVFNVMAPEKLPWAISFYDKLCARMLGAVEEQLKQTTYLAGEDYTIADVLAYPVAAVSMKRYPGTLQGHPAIARWSAAVGARTGTQRGMKVPA
jgi:GSH-dependent disulfide-bond oxidoreductase